MRRVKEVSRLTGVSVRTLHHYDDIGLLNPARSSKGYREYSECDLERLQQILIGRALGLPLERVRAFLDEEGFDRASVLKEQREKLQKKRRMLDVMIRAVDAALKGETMERQFEEFDHEVHAEDAEARWGNTEYFQESARRMKAYSDDDVVHMKEELEAINTRFTESLRRGESPEEAADVAESYRQHIDRWFYPCSTGFHVEVSELYTEDDRFRANFERRADGLAEFIQAAILANHKRGAKEGYPAQK